MATSQSEDPSSAFSRQKSVFAAFLNFGQKVQNLDNRRRLTNVFFDILVSEMNELMQRKEFRASVRAKIFKIAQDAKDGLFPKDELLSTSKVVMKYFPEDSEEFHKLWDHDKEEKEAGTDGTEWTFTESLDL